MKIVWKFSILQVCIVVCFSLVSFAVIYSAFGNISEQYVQNVMETRFQFINKEIEASAQKAVSETSVFVRLPAVFKAYEIALSGDINDPYSPQSQSGREFLRKELAPMLDSYNDLTGKKLELHFHLPNGLSLARMWREFNTRVDGKWVDISDDISAYRPTVMEANKTGKPALGIEVGSGGFAVRGVVPVIAPDGRLLGSAESLQQFNPILEAAAEEGKVFIALYANKELLDFSVELQNPERYPHIGDFVRVIDIKDSFVESLITAELLNEGKNGISYARHDSMVLAAAPISDYSGNQKGVMVCTINTSSILAIVNPAIIILVLMLSIMTVVPVLILVWQMRRVHAANERTRLMLNASPLGCILWNSNCNIIDCNETAKGWFGFKDGIRDLEDLKAIAPEYQPDGRISLDSTLSLVRKTFEEGACAFEWMCQTAQGAPLPVEITAERVKDGKDYIVATYMRDLREYKQMILEIEDNQIKMNTDPLTGIYNRRFFDESLQRLILSLSRSGGQLSLMMVDIDFFKLYNDTYGHVEGDNCLKKIAEVLRNIITRTDDFVARYGGEEFAVVLPNTNEYGARLIADKLLERIRDCNIPHEKSDIADRVTISIGIATGKAEHMHSNDDFIRLADAMLYDSKQSGRNKYSLGHLAKFS
ncbi:diguanylate cyclase [Desulfovibrio sp. OttesenSCG-928-C14]|nr:diguanylate cyclase [Desulfovibrio sp. OttesenSCG-928-C14]